MVCCTLRRPLPRADIAGHPTLPTDCRWGRRACFPLPGALNQRPRAETVVPFSLYPIPLVFTDGLGKDLAMDSSNAGKRAWYLMGQCLIGALASSLFGLPVLMYHIQTIGGEQFWLWMAANVLATGSSAYFLINNNKEDM